jgi:hypothetical protein
MKASKLALALAMAMTMGFASIAYADKGMDNIKAMGKGKDGMITKAEFMAMMEEKWNMMDKGKKGKLTAEDVAKSIKEIAATYGTSN